MPRTEQFGIGGKVDSLWLELLETVRLALYSKPHEKVVLLEKAILKTDSLRFFLQLCWESGLIANSKFETVGKQVEEVGRMLGGWKKGIITKTSPPEAEKKNEE